MPPTTNPSYRQRRLGIELRKLRERAGLTVTQAAPHLGVNQGRVSMIETGRSALSADLVRAMALAYDCPDEALVNGLVAMTRRRTRGWWEAHREQLAVFMADLAELEHHATALRVGVTVHMPGLLQTPEHARAVMRELVVPLRAYEVENRVSHRVQRQAVLFEGTPVPYSAVVHEAALRMGFGGPDVARGQLNYLLEMSELPTITLLVLPFGQTGFPAAGQPITYAAGAAPQLDTVVLDTDHGCEFLDAEAKLERYRSVLDRMESRALSEAKSRDLVRRIVRDL